MGYGKHLLIGAIAVALGACSGGEPQQPAAAGSAEPAAAPAAATAPADPAAVASLEAAIASADVNKGKVLFLQCRACHSLVPEAESGKIGPTLHGVVGRKAGAVPGFAYSDAVAQSGITWTADQIDHWLQRPSDFLPGNKMVFVGIEEPQDRANIIAYIIQESTRPVAP